MRKYVMFVLAAVTMAVILTGCGSHSTPPLTGCVHKVEGPIGLDFKTEESIHLCGNVKYPQLQDGEEVWAIYHVNGEIQLAIRPMKLGPEGGPFMIALRWDEIPSGSVVLELVVVSKKTQDQFPGIIFAGSPLKGGEFTPVEGAVYSLR